MSEQQPLTLTVPTEMEREDRFYVLAALFGSPLAAWWLWLHSVPVPFMVPPLLLVAIWVLTSESVVDVDVVGPIAAGLRSKLGLRRAHEWLMAWAHYFQVRTGPDWRRNCEAYYRSCRLQTTRWLRRVSERIRWTRSRTGSWAYRTRCSSWELLGKLSARMTGRRLRG